MKLQAHEGQGNWAGYAKRLTPKMSTVQHLVVVLEVPAKLKELLKTLNIDWATCRYFELSNDGVQILLLLIMAQVLGTTKG